MERFDPDALRAPISEEMPTGADPRENYAPQSLYFRLRDARSEARAAERQTDAAPDGAGVPPADWAPVVQLGTELLATEAKDLEVAAWCGEALLRTDGLPGLTAALVLMRGLVEDYWDSLHPIPDEEGMARRVAPIAGLNGEGGEGTLAQPLRKLILFERRDGTPLALWQYQQSAELAAVGDTARREQRIASGVVPFDQVEAEAQTTGRSSLAELRRAAAVAFDAWQALGVALDERAGAEAPSMGRIRDLLRDIVAICDRFCSAETSGETAMPTGAAHAPPTATASVLQHSGAIATREDALRILGEVADFFRRTEPHSPLAYTLYEAVRRGRLSLPELLEEIVPDMDSRASILRSLGILPPAPPE
jgi:type VI secretion system protein ImpA